MERADRMDQVDRVDVIDGNTIPSVQNNGNTPRPVSNSIGRGTGVALVQKSQGRRS